MELVELLTGNLNVVREYSEGISLEAFSDFLDCTSHYWRCYDLGHCAEVHECGGYLFPYDL